MRWNEPKSGDIKERKKFAILPVKVNGEARWLEWVIVRYKFVDNEVIKYKGDFIKATGWIPIKFID